MTTTIDDANAKLREAVEARREAQAAGKPHEEWYADDVSPLVAEPLPHVADVEDLQQVRWTSTEDLLKRLLEQQRLRGDGLTREQPSTSQRFLDLLDEMRRLHESKSADYGSETDPLANIRQGAEFVGIEPWRGCMVRIADKVQRLKTYCRTGRLVHEGVRDTLLDLSAYSLLAIVLFDEGNDA
jgi:hypothetical protein